MSELKFGKKQKWSFGMGTFAQWFLNAAFNTWVLSFYFVAVGLDIKLILLAFIIWTLWNAFNDPLIGYLSDRTRTRIGRRKPFIILGSIPILIIEIIVWLPPTGNQIITFVYLLIILICFDTFYTMVTLIDSVFPELYTSVEERAEVNTIKQVLATIGLILAFLVPGMFIGETLSDPSGYPINGIVTTILVGISLVVCIRWGVVEKEEFKLDHKHEFSFFKGMKYTFNNKGFILYTIMFFLFEYIILLYGSVIPLWGENVLEVGSTFETSLLLGSIFIVGIISVILWRYLDVKIGSRKSYAIAMVLFAVAIIPILFATDFISALLTISTAGIGFGGMLYFIYLIIADVIDEDELKTGVRREGTFFGVTNFFMRLSMVISVLSVSLVFVSTGWETWTPDPNFDILLGIRLLMVLFPMIAIILSLVCLYFYPFTKSKVDEIKSQLKELHEKKLETVRAK
ncbi:MAG: MFS transporter [Candidatus Hermodarchaeota archaeon]